MLSGGPEMHVRLTSYVAISMTQLCPTAKWLILDHILYRNLLNFCVCSSSSPRNFCMVKDFSISHAEYALHSIAFSVMHGIRPDSNCAPRTSNIQNWNLAQEFHMLATAAPAGISNPLRTKSEQRRITHSRWYAKNDRGMRVFALQLQQRRCFCYPHGNCKTAYKSIAVALRAYSSGYAHVYPMNDNATQGEFPMGFRIHGPTCAISASAASAMQQRLCLMDGP